jgi:hypothetical protein
LTKFLEKLAVTKKACQLPFNEKAAADHPIDCRLIFVRRIPQYYGVFVGLVLALFAFALEFELEVVFVVAGVMAGVAAGVAVLVALALFALFAG